MIYNTNFPNDWIIKPFTDCITNEVSSNKLKIQKNKFKEYGKYPIIDQSVEFIAGYTDDSSKVYNSVLPIVIFGDHTRIFKFIDFPFALGADGTKILVPKTDLLNTKYFYYFLSGINIENHGYSRHYKFLKEKEIIIPPLPTQKKIVAILDKAEKLKGWRREADELTDELLKSTFLEMFGDPVKNPMEWELKNLGEIGEVRSGLTLNSQRRANKENLFPYLRVANVYRNKLDLNDIKYIHTSDSEFEKFVLKRNDVLIVEGHGNVEEIGRAAIWNGKISNCLHQNHLIRVRLNNGILNPYFLSYFLNSYGNHGYFSTKSRTTSGLNTISTNKVRKAKVPLPPIFIQEQFADFYNNVEKIKEFQVQSIQHIEDLFDVLTQKAFQGDLI